jgi:uncharacterized protein YcfJ
MNKKILVGLSLGVVAAEGRAKNCRVELVKR